MPTLSGVWIWNDRLTSRSPGGGVTTTANAGTLYYTSGNAEGNGNTSASNISVYRGSTSGYHVELTYFGNIGGTPRINKVVYYDSGAEVEGSAWVDESYKTINFGDTEQEVNSDFYDWFVQNATKQAEPEPEPEPEPSTGNSKLYDLKVTLSDGTIINAGQIEVPKGEKGDQGPTGPQGVQGPQGIQGQQGPQGQQGQQGPAGSTGERGSFWYSESGAPTTVTGEKQYDQYLDVDTGDVYQREASAWAKSGNIKGPQGLQGAPGAQGTQGPAGAQGEKGDRGTNTYHVAASITDLTDIDGIMVDDAIVNVSTTTITVLSTALNPGDLVRVISLTPTQTISTVVGNIKGPKGDKGDAGEAGATGPTGPAGTAANIASASVTVDANVGTPSASVFVDGPDNARTFAFSFQNLKGEPGKDTLQFKSIYNLIIAPTVGTKLSLISEAKFNRTPVIGDIITGIVIKGTSTTLGRSWIAVGHVDSVTEAAGTTYYNAVLDDVVETTGEQGTISEAQINQIKSTVLQTIYQIGAYYITENTDNPSVILGFGTWTRVYGKFLIGDKVSEGLVVGSEGGEKEHTLTIDEMPEHHHDTIGGLSWSQILYAVDTVGNSENGMGIKTNSDNTDATYRSKMETNYTGGNQAHNNMPPYRVVFIWRRTA